MRGKVDRISRGEVRQLRGLKGEKANSEKREDLDDINDGYVRYPENLQFQGITFY